MFRIGSWARERWVSGWIAHQGHQSNCPAYWWFTRASLCLLPGAFPTNPALPNLGVWLGGIIGDCGGPTLPLNFFAVTPGFKATRRWLSDPTQELGWEGAGVAGVNAVSRFRSFVMYEHHGLEHVEPPITNSRSQISAEHGELVWAICSASMRLSWVLFNGSRFCVAVMAPAAQDAHSTPCRWLQDLGHSHDYLMQCNRKRVRELASDQHQKAQSCCHPSWAPARAKKRYKLDWLLQRRTLSRSLSCPSRPWRTGLVKRSSKLDPGIPWYIQVKLASSKIEGRWWNFVCETGMSDYQASVGDVLIHWYLSQNCLAGLLVVNHGLKPNLEVVLPQPGSQRPWHCC